MPGVSPITTHILDTAGGRPAAGVPIQLSISENGQWKLMGSGTTNSDGRLPTLLPPEHQLLPATYKMRFETKAYFDSIGVAGFYPYVEVVFELTAPAEHYHIPLL